MRRWSRVSLLDLVHVLANAAFYAYLVIFLIGIGWIVIGMVLGGIGHMVDFAHDMSGHDDVASKGEVGLSPLSPLMLAVFGMLFGVTGMALTIYTSLNALLVLVITAAVALSIDWGFYSIVFNYFVKAQASSLPVTTDAVGSFATVATRVGPNATGTINYEAAGRLQIAGARAVDGATHEPGTVVRITSMQGGLAQIKKED